MSSRQRSFHFARIHRLNRPLAVLLTLRGQVHAKIIDLPPNQQKHFHLLEYLDPDQWQEGLSAAHAQAQRLVRSEVARGGNGYRQLLEHQLIELEQISLFFDLVRCFEDKTGTRATIIPFNCSQSILKALKKELPRMSHWLSVNRGLDWLHDLIFKHLRLVASIAKGAFKSEKTSISSTDLIRIKTIVRGISEAEYAETDLELDFSWWIRRQFLDPETTLFILPSRPPAPVQARLAQLSIFWISERSLGSLITSYEKLKILFLISLTVLKTIFSLNPMTSMKAWAEARSEIWGLLFRKTSTTRLISSLSESWPENPELNSARLCGARIINWNYAGSSFGYAKTIVPFQDLALWRSVTTADEDWTWMKAHTEVIANRQLMTKPEFVEVGPMMCGDMSWLQLGPGEARAKFKIAQDGSVYLAVFDIPLFVREMRARRGYGPYTLLAMQEGLYSACIAAITRFPKLKLIIKRKRIQNAEYEFPESLANLLNPASQWIQNSRIHLLDAKTDPYIPIAMADISLAAPFTSPVILSDMLGKPSFYYDESGFAVHSFHETFSKITYNQEDALLSAVGKAYEAALGRPEFGTRYAEKGTQLTGAVASNIRARLTCNGPKSVLSDR